MAAHRSPERAHWPRGMYMPRPGYYIYREKKSKITRAIGYVSLEEAIAWVKENTTIDALKRVERSRVVGSSAWTRMKTRAYHQAKTRSRIFGRDMMTREEFEKLWKRAGGYCELSGLELDPRPDGCKARVHPWAGSLDRIDSSKGYTFDNCRIVCIAMNMALNEFGELVFRRLATGFLTSSSKQEISTV